MLGFHARFSRLHHQKTGNSFHAKSPATKWTFPKTDSPELSKRIIFAGKLEVEKYWSWLKYDDEI
jgi:hypothetical protein